ncbi:MAG: putative DNA modification/repair radical SAM protein [Candidatus Omnitrophica bacterium]|nr:putative DNA modification/repair radical SAM protein [Candidatus Omnitrophota bacterium]
MDFLRKLAILADSAKYDASCASSGSNRGRFRPGKGLGAASLGGVCHSWSADGRCISLLKILQSNVCKYDCSYCVNRCSNDIPRAAFTSREIADLTINFYRKNYIEGLFLSSGVTRDADYTMEQMISSVRILRSEYRFNGYVHMKLIPGARQDLIDKAAQLADRVSVNIELPTRQSLKLLAPDKDAGMILSPMSHVGSILQTTAKEKAGRRRAAYAPAGQSTQLIIGASPESDLKILRLSSWLYQRMALKRVYYSAYVPVNRSRNLPALTSVPLLREHRLYQADWLLRFYGFNCEEILDEGNPQLDIELDPKAAWALRHPEHFPVEVNKADYETLLRVPGLGVRSVNKIVTLRRVKCLTLDDLKKLRLVWKRARYFVTVKGRYYGGTSRDYSGIRRQLITMPGALPRMKPAGRQDSRVRPQQQLELFNSAITGEL